MVDILNLYETVSLEQMKCVRLMNRTDTKYVTTLPFLIQLLERAQEDYLVQEINGLRNMPYSTHYYDTQQCDMYKRHLHGHKRRQKIRIRTYEDSGVTFLEIKNKNNKGRTYKKRIACAGFEERESCEFINENSAYLYKELQRQVENRFSRITLVDRQMTERLTIDTNLQFYNLHTGESRTLDDLVIIELKRDGHKRSPILELLRQLHIHPASFSKYCIGMAMTNQSLQKNRFKPHLRAIKRMCHTRT